MPIGGSFKLAENLGSGKEFIKGSRCTCTFCITRTDKLLTGAMLARVAIDMLPDIALLEIFDFYTNRE
jgi:hypothetical protein